MDWGDCLVQVDVATIGCAYKVFYNIVNALLGFAGLTALIFFIFAGYRFINSSADAKKLEGARHTLTYAILGLIIVLFAFFIRELVYLVTGVPCVKTFGFGC